MDGRKEGTVMKSAKVVYYAKFDEGVILEDVEFRNVYNAARCELRAEYGHSLFFDAGTVTIYEGVIVEWTENGTNYFHHVPIRPVLTMRCSSIDRVTHFSVSKED